MMKTVKKDQAHPLSRGGAPAWATAWGEDSYGPWASFELGGMVQKLRWIPFGDFIMGSPEEEQGFKNERPEHQVRISKGFWLFDTPCTQGLWLEVTGENPSYFKGEMDLPVERVNWDDCQKFFGKLTARIPELQLELPSEAEWEYACRAGSKASHYGDEMGLKLVEVAWYNEKKTQKVKNRVPNSWGLYDMLGNVWEWCADGDRKYEEGIEVDPVGPISIGEDSRPAIRGGSWYDSARSVRAAGRVAGSGGYRRGVHFNDIGFRPRVQ